MNVEIINIGDELLIGQVVNTNAAWMAEQLNLAGLAVGQVSVIRDDRQHILDTLRDAELRAPIVLISGGIGPTRDDITKTTLCEYFGTSLVFNEEAYRDIETIFARRGYAVTELNRQQAELPENCITIPNPFGTARGMWFEKERQEGGKTIFVSMPGVPFEMKPMMTDHVIPRVREVFHTPCLYHKTILTQGIGESFLAARIVEWENALPAHIKLAYLPQPGMVRLRLTGTGGSETKLHKEVDAAAEKLEPMISEYIFGYGDDTLERIVGRLLVERNASLATVESCTGGYIAHLITSVPGSSRYFKGSVVAYANEIKEDVVGVQQETLLNHGAVSRAVVEEMAIAIQTRFHADYVVATSGIAGPDGGTSDKPVGTTWIAIATPGEISSAVFQFGDSRDRNIRRSALQALNMLRKKLIEPAV